MPYESVSVLGFFDDGGALIGMASAIGGFFDKSVWHIGLFIIATRLHGRGHAVRCHAALVQWMQGQGAQWLRLGVVAGNARAEAFWERLGYREVRRRGPMTMGLREQIVRVMVKPLASGSGSGYLDLVARDRPDAP